MSEAVALDALDRRRLAGAEGDAMQFAMRVVLRAAEIMGAARLVPVTFAHLDACFYVGEAHVDFAQYLLDHGAKFSLPAWTNVGLVSLDDASLRPESEAPHVVPGARRLMHIYAKLGARPVWTCAPYQLPAGPRFGEQIVVGESNAVAFYNSVVGARTNKYGDYLDVACALIGKAPYAGLHLDDRRAGEVLFGTHLIPKDFARHDIYYHLLGHHIGSRAGQRVPVVTGFPANSTEDDLKAVSSALAASGGVELWHAVGRTPEAPDVDTAFQGRKPKATYEVTPGDLSTAHRELSSGRDGPLAMVALGTPHFSIAELVELTSLLAGRRVHPALRLCVSMSRFTRDMAAAQGLIGALEQSGATIIVDTCTYFSPAVRGARGRIMTNAAKWAYYAPGMLGVEVVFGSLKECAESAVRGEVWRDPELWRFLS
jgi:predicted aconitase